MSDAADRLAQAIRDVINEAVRVAAVRQEPPISAPPLAAERPAIPQDDFLLCPWCNTRHMRHLMPVKEARHQLGGISWSRRADCGSSRSAAARSSRRNNSTTS